MTKTGFVTVDWVVFALYLGAVVCIGIWFSKRQRSTEEYFTAGKRVHWLPVSLSVVATLFSGISFLGHPARVFRYNCAMIAWPFAVLIITPILIHVLLPFYRRLDVTTAYEYLEKRFSLNVRLLASALFIGKRLFWMALVALAPSLALSTIIGLPVSWCILIIGVIATVYTGLGGMRAVIWTDAIQFVVLMLGQCLIIGMVAGQLDGGLAGMWRVGVADHKAWASLDWNLAAPTFWTFLLAGCFLALSDLGADQVTVQRLMCTKDEKAAAKALWFNALFKFPGTIILLGMGVALWVYYQQFPGRLGLAESDYDKIVPYFAVSQLPSGISGLVIAAIFAAAMSSFDSGLNSLAAALTVDWYARLGPGDRDSPKALIFAKRLTYVLGAAVTLTALLVYWTGIKSIIDASNKYLGFFGGALLGIFLLGALTRRAKPLPTVIGALLGVASVFTIEMIQSSATDSALVHPYLYGAISCTLTLAFGYFGSFLGPLPDDRHVDGLTVASLREADRPHAEHE